MIVIDKLKFNKFKQVSIPRNKDLFQRVGNRNLPEIQDGQIATFSNGTMEELSNMESTLLNEKQMPLDTDIK